jgi:hypothetical protein
MKKWALPVAIVLFFSSSFLPSANGATASVKISDKFTGTFSNSLKFAGKDCLNFQFKWKASRGLNYPFHFVSVSVTNQKKKSISQTFTIEPGDYYGLGQGSGVWSKTENWALCQSFQEVLEDEDCDPVEQAEYGDECEYIEVGGFTPGKYSVEAVLHQIKPFAISGSKKITVVISK